MQERGMAGWILSGIGKNLKFEMQRLNIDILGICRVRWKE